MAPDKELYAIKMRKRQLQEVALKKFHIDFPDDDFDGSKADMKLSLSSELSRYDQDTGTYVLMVTVDLNTEIPGSYSMSITAEGHFTVDPSVDSVKAKADVESKGVIDVYESLNSYIELLAANGNHPMLRLPSLDIEPAI